MTSDSAEGRLILNRDVSWDSFDPQAYLDANYRLLLPEDACLLRRTADHFIAHLGSESHTPLSGVDVGSGPNLYPALAMLPWCADVTLLERSRRNLSHLRDQVPAYAQQWDQFWDILCERDPYRTLAGESRERFRRTARIRPGDLFDLTGHNEKWSVGTMFFVADGITGSLDEFRRGLQCFMRALAPGAPFAAAFMEHSEGYAVGDRRFPACDIDKSDVYDGLSPYADSLDVGDLGELGRVRAGYTGMILALGVRGQQPCS
ncbi:SCO2525 family SAM-dependent methyltransferase [Streptomyces sp. NPDC058739]|uniref:SCO2525 family SAM-dependent methyltransferase n=1 Tax=Streptomyces sp. NPDC058739 TaxID=3346618 RepID=UPI0036A77090